MTDERAGMADEAWASFAAALQREVAALPSESFLLLREPGQVGHFAQFWQDPTVLRAEVAGEEVAGHAGLLSVRDQRLLAAVGFAPPAGVDDAGNWWQTLPWPASTGEYRTLVDAVVTALRDVQQVPAPASLVYQAWGYAGGWRRLELPGVAPDPEKY